MMFLIHAGRDDPFKVQDRPMDLIGTGYKMFMEIVSDFPIIFNKLPLAMLSYNILKSKIICKGYLVTFPIT